MVNCLSWSTGQRVCWKLTMNFICSAFDYRIYTYILVMSRYFYSQYKYTFVFNPQSTDWFCLFFAAYLKYSALNAVKINTNNNYTKTTFLIKCKTPRVHLYNILQVYNIYTIVKLFLVFHFIMVKNNRHNGQTNYS